MKRSVFFFFFSLFRMVLGMKVGKWFLLSHPQPGDLLLSHTFQTFFIL